MQVKDIFQINDWNIRHFFVLVLSLLLTFWGSIALDNLGLPISLLRQVIGFFFLTFIPGLLLLRVLRIHYLGAVTTIVYAAGLSLAILMFTGFFADIVYPLFGIFHPISLWSLMTTISALVGALYFLAWVRDRDFVAPISINLHEIFSPPVLALSLLPFGAIAGTYLMNFYDTNTLQMVLLLVIALMPVVIIWTRFIPEKYYPYAVFSVAITLLYHTALISTYIWGWDIHLEYYLTNTVIKSSFWDFTAYSSLNAMLSLVTLAPTYSILLGMELGWVFKVIYPFFLALVPLGLYVVFQKQVSKEIAFLACFFFTSIFVFYTEMISLARQEVAELFLVLILLSIIDQDISRQQKSALFIIFGASLVVSHYGLSYIFMLLLLLALAIGAIKSRFGIQDYINRPFDRIQEKTGHYTGLILRKTDHMPSIIPLHLVIWYGMFLLAWDAIIANFSTLKSVESITESILKNVSSDLFNLDAAQGIAVIVTETATPVREITKYLHLLTMVLIVVGFVVSIVMRQGENKFDTRYLLLSFGALGICIGGVALPYFASALNTTRLYQISLILLAPFGVIGGIALITKLKDRSDPHNRSLHAVAMFFGIFLLFNCGWVYEISHEESYFSLNNSLDSPVFSEQEIYSVLWLADMKDARPVAADVHRILLLYGFVEKSACHEIQTAISGDADCYIFLGKYNLHHKHVAIHPMVGVTRSRQYVEINSLHEKNNLIYADGDSKIYSLCKHFR
ncbi:hypothetical protein DSECCO2_93540 [anaerobic digester metagenome]